MNREELLIETSDGKQPAPCDSYDNENGYCQLFDKLCDGCYEEVII